VLRTLEPEAQELAEYMSELSDEACYAGWMRDLEFELGQAVVDGPREYGRLSITDQHIGELRRLSEAARGWIVFDDKHGKILLPMSQWKDRFETWTRTEPITAASHFHAQSE
jgi:hypothetical protein